MAEHKDMIQFDDFDKLELAVGQIVKCEKHPDADRLLVFTLDFGEDEPRTIVSGLAEFYDPAELAGRRLVALLNLKARKLRGIKSQGMILTSEWDDAEGKEHVEIVWTDAPVGAVVC